jgi:uroporphyrinogen decarboxylase
MTVTRQELVKQSIAFRNPNRVPVVYWNRDQHLGDVMLYHLSLGPEGHGDPAVNAWDWSVNEWGYHLESLDDGTMGHPMEPTWPELPPPGSIQPPLLREDERMAAVPTFLDACGDRYRLASFDLSGFTVYTLLRGFENSMEDMAIEANGFASLLDGILQFEDDLMAMAARHGFHGIHFADDWGTQSGLMISPASWRRLFKPRYRRQFDHAHSLGLDVWFHCCGNLTEIAEDFYEIGVDVLNIAQPNVVDVETVSNRLRGRQCFMMPISYQTVSIQGTPNDIQVEAQRLYELLGAASGGFIGYVEEYSCMGMSEENYLACGAAFRQLNPNCYRERQLRGNI